MSGRETNHTRQSRFRVAASMDPRSFHGASYLDDLDFNTPFDLLSACDREENRIIRESGDREWDPKNLKQNEIYRMPKCLIYGTESIIAGTSYSKEVAFTALIRHSFERQCSSCRLKRWWVSIRESVIHRDQHFVRPQHKTAIYNHISEYRMQLPDFSSGRKNQKFRMPAILHARVAKAAESLGYSLSEYCQYLIMRSLSECEGVTFRDQMRETVLECHRSLEERIRVTLALFMAYRITPCKRLQEALAEVDLNDYTNIDMDETN